MPKKKSNQKNGKSEVATEYPPFGDKEFWDRHERAAKSRERKDSIGNDVREFIDSIVAKYSDDGYDPRRDISWYMEQLGNNLRGDVEREKAAARQAEIKKTP